MSRRLAALSAWLCLPLGGCSVWFFSGETWIDRSRPVALVETTGGIECGATTEFGVLTLGRSAASGPCRVHYFLGPTPLVEDGALAPAGGVFTRAEIDLKTQAIRVMDRQPTAADDLVAMWTLDGTTVHRVAVALATDPGVSGDVLAWPGEELPAGAAILCRGDDSSFLLAGLVAGKATVAAEGTSRSYVVFAGVDRIREMVAQPRPHAVDLAPTHRPDDITVLKPVKQQ